MTKKEVDVFRARWKTSLDFAVLASEEADWRLQVKMDPKVVEQSVITPDLPPGIAAWILDNAAHPGWTVTEISKHADELTVDVVGPQLEVILQEINMAFIDTGQQDSGLQCYQMSIKEVDLAVAAGTALEADENGVRQETIPGNLIHYTLTREDLRGDAAVNRIGD
jgi:hypothetical protein